MTDPVDPNQPPFYGPPPSYQPPPPFAAAGERSPAEHAGYPGFPSYPGYPPPYDPGQPYGAAFPPPWTPAPPPTNQRRTILIVASAVVAAVAITAGLAYWLTRGSDPERVAVPDTFDGYTHLHNAASQRVEDSVRSVASSTGGAAGSLFNSGTIAVYGKSDAASLIVFVLPSDAVAGGGSTTDRVDELLSRLLTETRSFPSGTHGGDEKCGRTTVGTVTETACGWSDDKTTGIIVSVNPPLAPAKLASITGAMRDSVDK